MSEGLWLGILVCIEWMMVMLLMCFVVFEKSLLILILFLLYFWNLKGEGNVVFVFFLVCKLGMGRFLLVYFVKVGLGLNVLMCDGLLFMNRWIICLMWFGKCEVFGFNGFIWLLLFVLWFVLRRFVKLSILKFIL